MLKIPEAAVIICKAFHHYTAAKGCLKIAHRF